MSDKRLNDQFTLAFPTAERGEAQRADEEVSNRLRRTVQSKARREVISGEQSVLVANRLTHRTAVYGSVCTVARQGKRVTAYLCRFSALARPLRGHSASVSN